MNTYRCLLQYLTPYVCPRLVLAMVCMLAYSATDGALPFLVQRVIDDIFAEKDQTALYFIPAIIIAIFLFRGIMNFGQHYLADYVGLRIVNDLRNALNSHMQRLSASFFQRHATGTLISRVNNDVALVRSALTDSVASLVRDTASLVVLFTVVFLKDWVLVLIACIVFSAALLPTTRLAQKVKRFTTRGQITSGALTHLLQESIQGNRIVKAFGMEEYESRRFTEENEKLFKHSVRTSRARSIVDPTVELLASVGIAGVVWYGGFSVIAGGRTQGEFFAFMTAMFLMYRPFKRLTRTYTLVQQGLVGAERIFEILDQRSEIEDRPTARAAERFSRELECCNVSFGYTDKLILKNVNLKIRAGEMVALVGVSGAGKTTMADLIPRFYDVSAGKILMDGVDIRDLTLASLRSQIGIVAQQTFLFTGTIRNNIAYGNPGKDMDAITAAAKAAYAHEFIVKLPHGYDTHIGEMGLRLSGGQRQRLAIARALLKDAPILVLDEATSALDNESERLVQVALENLMTTRTTLVIAHRLSTIRKADRIVVLVNGTIAEEGTHEQLLARKSEYNRLYTLQLLGEAASESQDAIH